MRLTSVFSKFGSLGALVALSLPAWAEEAAHDVAAHADEHHGSPVPQFNPESFAGQLFWLAVSFALLYWAMNSWVLPKVGRVIESRAERIAADLAAANASRDQAVASVAAYDKSLAAARANAQALIAQAQATAARTTTDALSTQSRQLSDSARLTDARIRAAVAAAEANLLPVAETTTTAVIRQLTGMTPDAKIVAGAVQTALNNRRERQA